MKTALSAVPCPRCGCHLARVFECNCGACKDDYCVNCGRFCSLPRNEFLELAPYDLACSAGREAHEHTQADKHDRMEAWANALRASRTGRLAT